jgi:hypothetical protein
MTEEKRKALWIIIRDALARMTSDLSERDSVVEVGGHTCGRRLVYAGGSQWCGCGRDWDTTESAWAWVIDSRYIFTCPKLFGFDGHNMIERQTPYYLQPDFAETPPEAPNGEPLDRAPIRVLIAIGSAIHCAEDSAKRRQAIEEDEVDRLISVLSPTPASPAVPA